MPTLIIWAGTALTVWFYVQKGGEYHAGMMGFCLGIAVADAVFSVARCLSNRRPRP